VALVLNSVVGAGIFGLPSRVYALAGSYSPWAYVACAVPVILIILCFAEVSSRFRETGGPYLYARATFGPLLGFEIGWLTWLARVAAFGALANLFADYLAFFLPGTATGFRRAAAVLGLVAVLAATNIRGVRLASTIGNIVTSAKLLPLILFVVVGLSFPVAAADSAVPAAGYSGFSSAVLLLVFAFSGFENAVIPAGEVRDPQRHLPFALLAGATVAMILYIAIQVVCMRVLPDLASSQRPLADAGARLLGQTGAAIMSAGALISVVGTMNAIMLVTPRLLFAMAEHGQLPGVVARTHADFRTPHVAILLTVVAMLALTFSRTFASAALLSTIIRLATYGVTCAALPVLRRRAAGAAAFVVPGGSAIAAGALVLIAWLFSSSSWLEMSIALLAAAAGGAIGIVARARGGMHAARA
jgi:basic amino acid/polyamine antiporter, APA family